MELDKIILCKIKTGKMARPLFGFTNEWMMMTPPVLIWSIFGRNYDSQRVSILLYPYGVYVSLTMWKINDQKQEGKKKDGSWNVFVKILIYFYYYWIFLHINAWESRSARKTRIGCWGKRFERFERFERGGVYGCVCEGKEEYESFLGRTSVCGLIIPFPIPYPLLFYIGIYFLWKRPIPIKKYFHAKEGVEDSKW